MTVLLVDGDNILMRGLHAARDSMDHDGINTGPVVIFMNMLSRVVQKVGPDRILVAFDHSDPMSPMMRRVFFPEYKAHRKPRSPEDQEWRDDMFQMTRLLLDLLHVHAVSMPSMEADDLIASAWAWTRLQYPGERVYVFSGDKDLLQLADASTTVLRPTNKGLEEWGPDEVSEHFGVPATALAAYLALVGDVSDNIPGVRGWGPKKAVKVLSQHDFDFERMLDAQPDGWEHRESAEISYVLVDLITDPLVAPGVVHAEPYPERPELTDDLSVFLDTYGLQRLHNAVQDGTLWGAGTSQIEQMILDELEGS